MTAYPLPPGTPAALIVIGTWLLVSALLMVGRALTGWPIEINVPFALLFGIAGLALILVGFAMHDARTRVREAREERERGE